MILGSILNPQSTGGDARQTIGKSSGKTLEEVCC
jgi:hypothetical protein